MAELKQYAYYIKGTKVAIVERDTTFDNDLNSKDFGPGSDRAQFKSPLSSVDDALEIQYVCSPLYTLDHNLNISTINGFKSSGSGESGSYLSILDTTGTANYDNVLNVGQYIVLENAGKYNGLHKIQSFSNSGGTNNVIVTWTKEFGLSSTSAESFEKTVKLYYAVNVLDDENDTIDLPEYLCKALVDYIKGKLAEDVVNIEVKEYYMKEFRKKVEKFNNSRVSTIRLVAPGSHAIR